MRVCGSNKSPRSVFPSNKFDKIESQLRFATHKCSADQRFVSCREIRSHRIRWIDRFHSFNIQVVLTPRIGRTGDYNYGMPRCCEYGAGGRGRGNIKWFDSPLCWVRSMLPLSIPVLILCRILVITCSRCRRGRSREKFLENEDMI